MAENSRTLPEFAAALSAVRQKFGEMELYENEPMSRRCSFRSGGSVRAFALPGNTEELIALCALLRQYGILPFILGNGTNVVFTDEGDDEAFVVSTEKLRGIALGEDGVIRAEAGVPLSKLAAFAYEHSLTGLEFASGIPGTVGGGILMNAGAYGGELKDVAVCVHAFHIMNGQQTVKNNPECGFSYRHSVFQEETGSVILRAEFRLCKGEKQAISAKMNELNARRREKQPLDLPSAGSTFRRPEGYYAAALIDECGLRGMRIGGAQVSEKHAGFIVNAGGATTADLQALIRYVQEAVYTQKRVVLQPEVIIAGREH